MGLEDIFKYAASLLPSLIMLAITQKINIEVKKREKLADERNRIYDERNEARRKESMLMLEFMKTCGNVTYATGKGVRDGHVNGEMSNAMEEYCTAKKKLEDFFIEQGSHNMYSR